MDNFKHLAADDFDDDLWDDDELLGDIPMESGESEPHIHHRFIVGPDSRVYKGPGGDTDFHENIARQHGISDERNPGEHHTGPYTLGTAYTDGRMEIHKNGAGLSHPELQAALAPHFPNHAVPTEGLEPNAADDRWGRPITDAERSERSDSGTPNSLYDKNKALSDQAEQERGRPFGYYDNPWLNRGGSVVSNDGTCQQCGHVATGPSYQQEVCESCGAQPYAHQPTPMHSEMEMRTPGQEGMSGNPLQEGILADGGWQNRMKRDESFASVKQADSYPLPSGGEGQYHECPNCAGQMGEEGECYRCGYTIPYDGGEVLDGHHDPEAWATDMGIPHVQPHGLGPVHQGTAPFNEEEDEYEMNLEEEKKQVAARIAAWDRLDGMRNNFYEPWDRNFELLEVKREAHKLAAQVTHEAGLVKSVLQGAGTALGGLAGSIIGPEGTVLGAMAGRALGSAAGGAVGGAIEGHPAPAAPAPQAPVAPTPWESLSSIHAQLSGELGNGAWDDTPSSSGFNKDTDDPEDVDPHEHNDGEDAPEAIENAGGSGALHPEVWAALEEAEGPLEHYMRSDESGAHDPAIAKLVEVLHAHHPEIMEYATSGEPDSPEVEELLKDFKPHNEPSAVGGKLGYAPGIGGMMPAQGPVAQPAVSPQVSPHTQGSCTQCGARLMPGQAVCPQCNAAIDSTPEAAATAVNPQAPVGPAGQPVPPVMASVHNSIIADRFGANQGPHNPEQFQAVKQYLDAQGRGDMIQDLIDHPENFGDILAEIQNKQQPPQPDPDPGPPPPQPPMPPGGDPSMPPGDPSQGQMPMMAAVQTVAEQCPKCKSHTTEILVTDIDPGNMLCHACGHQWKKDGTVPTHLGKTAFEHDTLHPHPTSSPAADQVKPDDPSQDINPGQWQAQDGSPLVVGQQYEMYSAKYDVPDVIRIEAVKPDSIEYTLTGEYGLEHRTEISKQEADMDGITFLPADDGSDPEAQMNEEGPTDQMAPPQMDKEVQSSYSDDLWDDRMVHTGYARLSGAKYTPMEQRDFIDEKGTARNADKLDLAGTHYESREQGGLSDDLFLFGL